MYYIFMDDSSDGDSEHHNFVKMNINPDMRYSLSFHETTGYAFCVFLSGFGYDSACILPAFEAFTFLQII